MKAAGASSWTQLRRLHRSPDSIAGGEKPNPTLDPCTYPLPNHHGRQSETDASRTVLIRQAGLRRNRVQMNTFARGKLIETQR